MKIISWNVNGIRAAYRKGLSDFIKKEKPDILCLQETKAWPEQLSEEELNPHGYKSFFTSAEKKGYSGVAVFHKPDLKIKLISQGIEQNKFDSEGRFLVVKANDFVIYNIYFPSGTSGDVRQAFKYEFLDSLYEHIEELPKSKRHKLIICGDYNICHKEIDIHHPKQAEKLELSGFLPDERAWMDQFENLGFVDSFRNIKGNKKEMYTWWSYRAGARKKNLGWRIDYFFVASKLKERIKNANILNKVEGSDHCPIVLEMT